MESKKAFELFEQGILKKGCKVKMGGIKRFEGFIEVENAFIKKARLGEMEDDWVVIIVYGLMYDAAWIEEVQ